MTMLTDVSVECYTCRPTDCTLWKQQRLWRSHFSFCLHRRVIPWLCRSDRWTVDIDGLYTVQDQFRRPSHCECTLEAASFADVEKNSYSSSAQRHTRHDATVIIYGQWRTGSILWATQMYRADPFCCGNNYAKWNWTIYCRNLEHKI